MLSTGVPGLDEALAEALAQPVRQPVWHLAADIGGGGTFQHPWSDLTNLATDIQVERFITGDLPEGTTLTEGYASASLTARLEGRLSDGTPIIDAVTRRGTTPTWSGVGVRYDLGLHTRLGPVLLRQFTGTLRATTVRASTGTVEITAADGAEQLRAAITLPSIGLDGLQLARHGENYRYWMNSQWIIDYVLRANGILNSAPPMPGAVLSVTGHGALAPEIGFGGQPTGSTGTYTGPLWITGPDGMLAPNGGGPIPPYTASYTGDGQITLTVGTGFGMGLWVHHGAGAPLGGGLTTATLIEVQPGDQRWARLTLNPNGGISIVIHNIIPQDVTVTCPIVLDATVKWRFIGAHLLWSAGPVPTRPMEVTITWFVDSVTATTRTAVNILGGGEYPSTLATVTVPRPISGIHVWSSATPPDLGGWPRLPTIRPADVDPGLNELTYLPVITGRDSWDLIKEVAAAEYGVPGFNESGRFSFLNRATLTDHRAAPPTATLTTSELAEVTETTSMDSVRNEIAITATPAYTRDVVVLVASTDPQSYVVAAGETLRRVVVLPEGTVGLTTGNLRAVTSANWNDKVLSGYVASRADQPTVEVTSNVTVQVRRLTGTTARILVFNTNTFPIRLATNDAEPRPALRISGTQVTTDPAHTDTVTDPASITRYRRRSLDLGSHPWRQRLEPFQALARTLLDDLASPTSVFDRIPVLGDPRRALTDTVTLAYPAVVTASIIGITRRLSTTDGMIDELTIRPHRSQPRRGCYGPQGHCSAAMSYRRFTVSSIPGESR